MQADGSDFAGLIEYVEEKIGRTAAWVLAFAIGLGLPITVVAAGTWWYLG
jgi:ABC-type nickel/cobalt efflux system permease component RcnA